MERMIIAQFDNELVLYLERDPQQGAGWQRLLLEQAGVVRISAKMPSAVSVPEWASEPAGDGTRALSVAAVKREVDLREAQAKAELVDALRALESVHVTWDSSNAFLGLTTATSGEIKLLLADWLLEKSERIAEFSLHSTLALAVKPALPNVQVSSSFCCALHLNRPALLRVDLDDLNFSFPEFEFPDLSATTTLVWPGDIGSSRLLDRLDAVFASHVNVSLKATPAQPLLAIDLSGGVLRWALVASADPVNWVDIEPQLAQFEISFKAVVGEVSISRLTVANTGSGLWLKHQPPQGTLEVLKDHVHNGRLGPLEVQVSGLSVSLAWLAQNQDRCLLADVTFERLQIRLADDPQTFITLKGQVQFTTSASRIIALELVEPYPLALLDNAGAALLRGARSVVAFLASLEGPEATAPRLTRLLEILGRFAAALAKAVLFVGKVLADALAMLGHALDALAQGICAILTQLKNPFGLDEPDLPALQFEVRVGLAPLQLRQILILRKTPLSGERNCVVAGLELKLHQGWQPGLLLDFIDNPGAYLLLSHPQPARSTPIAELGTDLWLENSDEHSASHMPDAAENDGQRASTRIIALKTSVSASSTSQRLDIVLVGVGRGQAVFFKQLKGSLHTITPVPAGVEVKGRLQLEPLDLDVDVAFAKDRLLPLLGMGEPGIAADPPPKDDFLKKLKDSFAQVVWVENFSSNYNSAKREVNGELTLGVKAAGIQSQVKLALTLALETLRVKLQAPTGVGLKSRRIFEQALGLTWVIEQLDDDARKRNDEVEMFTLSFLDGESGLGLNPDKARMELRFNGLSANDDGIVFKVSNFFIGRRGIDISATVDDRAVRINGLDVPFRFHTGRFKMAASKLVEATICGRGTLPPALIGDAECTLDLAFGQDASGIVLQSGKVAIDKKGEAIVCHATRFTLNITDLDIGIQLDGGYHLYLLVTGSLRFTPKAGEFEGGLLGFLKDIEISLERTPLTGDARVLARHISFQKALNPKKSFSLFNLFTFELRGFGFHPSSDRFDGAPAINLSGQIKFAEIGDVMQPKIDFHGLWIAPARKGEALPRISAEGLGLDLQLAGSVKVRGAVLAVDPSTRTVEGKQFAPVGYNTYGFLGEGEVEIPGWGTMQASLGFLEVERKDVPGTRRKAFFVYLQKDKLAVEVPTGFWNFYMREAGMGFGFRYTLTGIRAADEAKTPAQLIRVLDDVSKRQGDLARFGAWTPDPEGDRFTLALRAALQAYPAKKTYIDKEEEVAQNPFFFDMIVALRSDLTLLASLRGWLGVNYADFRANKDSFRERPGLRGYLYISAPRSELLARMVGDSKGFIGERFEGLRTGEVLRRAVESVDWSATLYIRPGLFHYELGWPDQLAVRLVDSPNMKVTLRGGMIFRAADDGLLWGYNIEADAWLAFGGSSGGSVGVAVEATLQARFVARLIAYLSWRFSGSMVYGLVMLDASLTFRVRAWMEIDLGFKSFTIRIGFSYSVQFSAAIEMAVTTSGVGGRGNARLAISVFGCTLSVGVGFAFNSATLDAARAQVQRFLAMSISADQPDLPPAVASKDGDQRIDAGAQLETRKAQPQQALPTPTTAQSGSVPKPDLIYPPGAGRSIGKTNFWLVLHEAAAPASLAHTGVTYAYGLLVPREVRQEAEGGFYASPPCQNNPLPGFSYRLDYSNLGQLVDTVRLGTLGELLALKTEVEYVFSRWTSKIPVDTPQVDFWLDQLFDECFLTSTAWQAVKDAEPWRLSLNRQEPKRARQHQRQTPQDTRDEAARAAQRDHAQRQHAADAVQYPADDRAHQARSTAMSMFLEQFVAFASGAGRTNPDEAHVLDLGMMFYGPVEQLEKLAQSLTVYKHDQTDDVPGSVEVFNPAQGWFQRQDPIFDRSKLELGANGLCMNWDLSLPWLRNIHEDPDQFLHHYEIRRTIEGREYQPRMMQIKPAATLGESQEGKGLSRVALYPTDWQYIDDFADLPADWRRALLPSTNESDALLAARAWTQLTLPSDVTFTYSVTPVDIAGTRGLSKSFLYTFEMPRAPVRSAEAEIRVVQTLYSDQRASPADSGLCWQTRHNRPNDLALYIAVHDPAWKHKDGLKAKRSYTLIVEQEQILPAGSYAAGGATDKVRGLGSAGAQAVPVQLHFEIQSNDLSQLSFEAHPLEREKALRARVQALEPDQDTLRRFDRWGALSGEPGWDKALLSSAQLSRLLDALWISADGQRVATRFWLRTNITLPDDGQQGDNPPLTSHLVPVACELTMDHRQRINDKESQDVELNSTRPEVFEWPVHLRLPPLPQRQVRVRSGFLHLRMPVPGARLEQWAGNNEQCIEVQRDSARRSAVHLEFDVVPNWDSKTVEPLHLTSVAGFDLHELDLDDLAPLDTRATALENSPDTWKRARRVAHIELLAPEEASLVPSNNADWLGWQAHYPSESWRAKPCAQNQVSAPRRAWYSARETTPCFPERLPRQRLLLQAPESAIIELLRNGVPDSIMAKFAITVGSPAARTLDGKLSTLEIKQCVPIVENAGVAPQQHFFVFDQYQCLRKEQGDKFSASVLRYLLLSLCLEGLDSQTDVLALWRRDPGALDGLNLELSAYIDGTDGLRLTQLASVQVALDFRSPLHPLLEETLAELALRDRQPGNQTGKFVPQVYRAYNVMLQPAPQVDARELNGYLAASPASSDPYGWGVLQGLGLAATLRLYDLGKGRFLRPSELAARVDAVFSGVLARWQRRLGNSCQAFAEVLLKPGGNRVVRPFDATSTATTGSKAFQVDDDGLAMIQLSLRPTPEMVWKYRRLTFDNVEACLKALEGEAGNDWTVERISLCLKRVSNDNVREVIDLVDPATGYGVTLGKQDEQVKLQLAQARLVKHRLWERYPDGRNDFAGIEMWYELQVTISPADGKPAQKTVNVKIPTTAVRRGRPLRDPGAFSAGIEVFELFAVHKAEAWARQMKKNSRFTTLLAHLHAVTPDFADPEPDAYTSLMEQYAPWSQRLLDYAAAPEPHLTGPAVVNLALAAPSKTNPLRLAADAAGCVRLYIPSDDRWGHARAYALRPVSRYAHLMASVKVLPPDERERLVTADMLQQPIGHAIAVVPRTERIEPPVILGSSIQHETWELMLARHGEESLAASNRSLFARLGKPDVLLTQLRAYRSPGWPEKLTQRHNFAVPNLYPQRKAVHPQQQPAWERSRDDQPPAPGELRRLTPARLAEMAESQSGLWKGADVVNFPAVAPHYKVLAVAAARAGIVVSELVSVLQDDLPRRALRTLDNAKKLAPILSLKVGKNNETLYLLSHRLLSHHDLTPQAAREWDSEDPRDVRWWPDPDISYQLLYHAPSGATLLSEELSNTGLVAEDPATAAVAVRCRGTRWTSIGEPDLVLSSPDQGTFSLTVTYAPILTDLMSMQWLPAYSSNLLFERAISRIGRVLAAHERSFGLEQRALESESDYEARILGFPSQFGQQAVWFKFHGKFDTSELLGDCLMVGERVEQWLKDNGTGADLAARFTQAIRTGNLIDLTAIKPLRYWPRSASGLPAWEAGPLQLTPVPTPAGMPEVLILWDIPIDSEIDALLASGHELTKVNSRFWQLLVQRLRGNAGRLELRAVDARATWPGETQTQHPGVTSVAVQWPKLVTMIS
ncbi:hypothetical protein [Pseudomonas rubra]|uniref:LysM domain-containing protein n=1 Tax=Pseudomonas rubra TaxID=2942627 RepID=A0ABT5PAG9_9PSED|nr:hypothetical protein [Pseudomonas rubra]MDD1015187.1 hypothetical protein [Pseudomonas rubra]MDD1037841.1 hypothetical protein [Pseudomonas rubra]MDD1152830.1 hypothetical protein [Pseudomonas rubra]